VKTADQFVEYIDQDKPLILKVAGMYTNTSHDRADLIQEIILQLWSAFQRLNPEISISTWTHRIAINTSINFLRSEAKRKKRKDAFKNHTILFSTNEYLDERIEILKKHIAHLKSMDKAIIILHLEGKMNTEIAEIMGIGPSNVSTRLNRIKDKLKKQINPQT